MNQLENSYQNKDGYTVMTSSFLKKRGSCCKSSCLHCPYGFTLRKPGLKLEALPNNPEQEVIDLYNQIYGSQTIANNLLGSAFGKEKNADLKEFTYLSLKGTFCGLALIQNNQVHKLILKEHFNDQGITKAFIEGLLV